MERERSRSASIEAGCCLWFADSATGVTNFAASSFRRQENSLTLGEKTQTFIYQPRSTPAATMSFPASTYEKYETETIIRNPNVRTDGLPDFVNERVRDENGVKRENVTYTNSGPAIDTPPPVAVYLKGFGRVIGHAVGAYRDIVVDVFQSMVVLFLQHPSIGVFFLVAAGFTLAPILAFVGFALISSVTVFLTALVVEGIALGVGIFVLLFAVPTAFFTGLGAASTAVSAFFVINAFAKFVRGRDIVDEFRTSDRADTEGRVYRQQSM